MTNCKQLSPAQMHAIDAYRRLEISFDELRRALQPIIRLEFTDSERRVVEETSLSELAVMVNSSDVQKVLSKFIQGKIDESEVSQWAAILRMSSIFDIAGESAESVLEILSYLDVHGRQGAIKLSRISYFLRCLNTGEDPSQDALD